MNSAQPAEIFEQTYSDVKSPRVAALRDFRLRFAEKAVRTGGTEWRYRVAGTASRALLVIPGGELVNDLGFEFALAMSGACRVVYPAYPRVDSIGELADGLCAILDAEKIKQAALALPWSVTIGLLRRPLLKTIDHAGADRAFWSAYFNEPFSMRLTQADVLANIRNQIEYHRRRQALRDTYPNAELRMYHDAGHAPMFSRFDEYVAMVQRFLDGEKVENPR